MAKHRRTLSNERGFSLLELLVCIGILTVIMGAAFSLMNRSQTSFDRNQLLAEARANADFAILRVTEIIRGAGSNPEGDASINSLRAVTNYPTTSSTSPDLTLVRVRSDLNGDKDIEDRVDTTDPDFAPYFIIASEDVTIQHISVDTTINGVDVSGNTLILIDNTPDTDDEITQGVPVVLAQNVIEFSCPIEENPLEVTLTITAGPTREMDPSNSRFVSFTRTMQIRLRNRS